MFRLIKRALAALTMLTMLGCVSIPQEAPTISAELGKRISAIEEANITLLNRFFDQKRAEVDRFIEQEWTPVFAKEVFSDPKVVDMWNQVVRSSNDKDRLKFLVLMGPKLQTKINAKRLTLIRPLDDLERRIEDSIRADFNQARAINNTITSFLLSASEVTVNRDRYLEMAGVGDQQLNDWINLADNAVSELLEGAKDGESKIASAEKYLTELNKIRDSI
ncbi:hypothetical protein [Endozoicomonas sp. YOMI1]|uniref:hypothetical protein n=1 Tax=Endozoicomonas sp. YOMI1 TaxID=2828739 RepID=UPI00214809FC|nr:hypothetical protein [Endozoicomonas sp. YOMI1]